MQGRAAARLGGALRVWVSKRVCWVWSSAPGAAVCRCPPGLRVSTWPHPRDPHQSHTKVLRATLWAWFIAAVAHQPMQPAGGPPARPPLPQRHHGATAGGGSCKSCGAAIAGSACAGRQCARRCIAMPWNGRLRSCDSPGGRRTLCPSSFGQHSLCVAACARTLWIGGQPRRACMPCVCGALVHPPHPPRCSAVCLIVSHRWGAGRR